MYRLLLYSQAATEQAARALALYAKEAQELRDQLAQAQAQNSRGSGTLATFLKSARRSFLKSDSSTAALEEVLSPLVSDPGVTGW